MTIPANIVDATLDPGTFGPQFEGPSWNGWRTVLKAAFAIPMDSTEHDFFHTVAERDPPEEQVPELWVVAGRGAGKDSIAGAVVAYMAASFSRPKPAGALARIVATLRPGERALCACLSCSRDQSRTVLDFTRSYFNDIPALAAMVTRETLTGFELNNGVEVAISTNDFRNIRGRSILCAVLDEVAFFASEDSSNPDEELYRAILPGLARVPGSMLIGISSPYKKSGLLHRKFEQHYGRDSDILVVRAPTQKLNPVIDPKAVARAIAEDPVGAQSEWNAEFRDNISGFVLPEVVQACTEVGVFEIPPDDGVTYSAFLDMAGGGSGGDSAAAAIAHKDESGLLILDCLHEIKPPFSAARAIDEFAAVFLRYRIKTVYADGWAKGFVIERLQHNNLTYRPAPLTKAKIYSELLPNLNSKRVRLLDIARLRSQLLALDRRPGPGGVDVIEHPRRSDARDDAVNSAAGALVMAAARRRGGRVMAVGVGGDGSNLNSASWHYGPDGLDPNRWGAGVATSPAKVAADRARDPRLQKG